MQPVLYSDTVFKDDLTLYTISKVKAGHLFEFWDVDTLTKLGEFQVQSFFNPAVLPVVDKDCVYFTTTDGLVVGVDKFAGNLLTKSELGSMICEDLIVGNKNIYCLCSIPINFKTHLAISICDKYTGHKILQTQTFQQDIAKMSVRDKTIYLLSDKSLTSYDEEGTIKSEKALGEDFYDLIITQSEIYCFSKLGIVKVLNRDSLSEIRKMYIAKSGYAPIFLDPYVYWFTGNGGYKFNSADSKRFMNRSFDLIASPVISEEKIYFCDQISMMSYDLQNNTVSNLIENHKFPKGFLLPVGNHILFVGGGKIWDVL